jgi:formamidopyrimidine-DNA glycosylase
MPELPEVETVVRGLRAHIVGRRIVHVEQRRADLRAPLPRNFKRRVTGRRVAGVERRAKYIMIRLAAGPGPEEFMIVHLGMSGRFVLLAHGEGAAGPHDHVEFRLDDGALLRFSDPRRFGLIDLLAPQGLVRDTRFSALGPEPLSDAFTAGALEAALAGRRGPIKPALLDQRLVAGIGNIYACEALFRAGISPRRRAGTIRGERAERLVAAVKQVLESAIAAGGSSARDYVQASGEVGWFQEQWAVYDREGARCPGCDCNGVAPGGRIRRLVQGGRSTFYCAKRQR